MTSMIKNALIKQLSKYLKNVSANQINISTFKGEGEMKNIQLDENVLMDLLELPTWLKITNATCTKANFKIQLTKLKTQPIYIYLESISILMETTEDLRELKEKCEKILLDSTGPYGFIDRCIDGMSLSIDSITITLKSKTFNATLDLSNVNVYSTTPTWQVTQDVRLTRIRDTEKGELLIFKEIAWETCRVEAYSIDPVTNSNIGTPIKLIMNPSKAQITLKKRLSDKALLASKMRVLLNEIYWMANDTQLKAAIVANHAIQKLIKKAFKQKTKYAMYKIQQEVAKEMNKKDAVNKNDKQPALANASKVFRQFDIAETSLHLQAAVLNIHLYCDENFSGNKLIDGGTIQILIKDLSIDQYPYHKVGTSINHWNNYNPHVFEKKQEYSKKLLTSFTDTLGDILKRSNVNGSHSSKISYINLIESCTVLTLKECSFYMVTTNYKSNRKSNRKYSNPPNHQNEVQSIFLNQPYGQEPFICSNVEEFNLPADTLLVNAFLSDYYFPEEYNYPLPHGHIYAQISPVKVNIDYITLLWLNSFLLYFLNETKLINETISPNKSLKNYLHTDIHIECILPKVCLKLFGTKQQSNVTSQSKPTQPNGLNVSLSRIVLTNVYSLNDLHLLCKKMYKNENLCMSLNEWPYEPTDCLMISSCFHDLILNDKMVYVNDYLFEYLNQTKSKQKQIFVQPKTGLLLNELSKNSLNKYSNKDVWQLDIDNLWIDFIYQTTSKTNNQKSLLKPVSFKLWHVNTLDFYKFDKIQTISSRFDLYSTAKSHNNDDSIIDFLKRVPNTKNRQRSKSETRSRRTTRVVGLTSKQKLLSNSNLNFVCAIDTNVVVQVNNAQINFFYLFLDELSLFVKHLSDDVVQIENFFDKRKPILSTLSPKKPANEDRLSITASLIFDSIELRLYVNDNRRCVESVQPTNVNNVDPLNASAIETSTQPQAAAQPQSSTKLARKRTVTTASMFLIDNDSFEFQSNLSQEIFFKEKRMSNVNLNNGNSFILVEYLQEIYGVLDNSKYLNHSYNTAMAGGAQNECFTISSKVNESSRRKSELSIASSSSGVTGSVSNGASTLGNAAILELSVLSLKAEKFFFSRNKSSNNVNNSDVDSVDTSLLDLGDDYDDLESLSGCTFSNIYDQQQPQQQRLSTQYSQDDTITTTSQFSSTPVDSTPSSNVTTPMTETSFMNIKRPHLVVSIRLRNTQVCAQIIDDDVNFLCKLDDIDINDTKSYAPSSNSIIQARFSKGPSAERKQYGANYSGVLELRVRNKTLSMNMSALTGILEMLDSDAVVAVAAPDGTLPIKVLIKNFRLNVNNDAVLATNEPINIGIPLNVLVKRLKVNRYLDGEIVISETDSSADSYEHNRELVQKFKDESLAEKYAQSKQSELKELLKQFMDENDKLKQQLSGYESIYKLSDKELSNK